MAPDTDRAGAFRLAVLALFTAAFSAALRAAVAGALKAQWIDPLDRVAAGEMTGSALGSAFLGFAVTLFVASAVIDLIGTRRLLAASGICFLAGTALITGAGTIAGGMTVYRLVWAGMLVSGIGWGLVEATINPLIARLYPEDTTHRLNMLHAWYPGGMIVGGLAGVLLAPLLPWQAIMALALIPAGCVAILALAIPLPTMPETTARGGSASTIAGIFRHPGFFVWFGAMFLTASSELAPGQWIDVALSHRVGMRGILLLVYVSALMFVFRHFVGRVARRLSNVGLLWVSSLLAAIGLFLLAHAQSPLAAIAAATIWGLGVCAMWPTMLASVAERYPRGGAWALGLVGSAGALASFFVLPALGAMFDAAKLAVAGGPDAFARLNGEALRQVEDAAASFSFQRLALVPVALLFVFGAIWMFDRRRNHPTGGGNP